MRHTIALVRMGVGTTLRASCVCGWSATVDEHLVAALDRGQRLAFLGADGHVAACESLALHPWAGFGTTESLDTAEASYLEEHGP
jgi:hypothetical protein